MMNNHVFTDEKYKVATSRKEKHLVSVWNAVKHTAPLLISAEGRSRYGPFIATPVHELLQSPSPVAG